LSTRVPLFLFAPKTFEGKKEKDGQGLWNEKGIHPCYAGCVLTTFFKEDAMQAFMEKHRNSIIGVLSGWDRIVFRGTLRPGPWRARTCAGWDRIVFRGTLRLVANLAGMNQYLSYLGILMKDFKQYALDKTAQLIQASVAKAERAGRPNLYLHSSRTNKGQVALDIAAGDGVKEGLICILRTIEPCMTYQLHRNRQSKTLDLELFQGKCMHLYHYWYDAYFGFMGARIQTWFPFAIQMWMNGREWLARTMDQEHLAYRRCDNCFPWIADFARAQALMDQLHRTDWCRQFDRIARFLNQAHANSVKTYDKAGSILRTECTINNARAFRVYRQSERDPQGPKKTILMSKGIVDLYAQSDLPASQ